MRSYYCLPVSDFDQLESLPDSVLVGRDEDLAYILAFTDPCESLELVGAERLGSKLHELDLPIIEQLIQYRVRRLIGDETIELIVPATEINDNDEILGEAMPRVIIAGDDPEDYL